MRTNNLLSRWSFGMRTVKTALAVLLCLLLGYAFGYSAPLYACFAAVLTMQDTERKSFSAGARRLMGTAVGGMIGLLLLGVHTLYPHEGLRMLLAAAGVMLGISICCNLRNQEAAPITAIVVLGLVLGQDASSPFLSALVQVLETVAGVLVAVLVNRFVARPKEKKAAGKDPEGQREEEMEKEQGDQP